MSNSNGVISAPVSIYDIQQVLGISGGGDLGKIILSAKSGGSIKPGENWERAFWALDYYKEGFTAIGYLIKGAEPYFNLFSEQGPVQLIDNGTELRFTLKKASYVPVSVEINGVLTSIFSSFSLEFFDGYNHNAMKCELVAPETFISNSSTKLFNIIYKIPYVFALKLPDVVRNSFYVLSSFKPTSPDVSSFKFLSVMRISDATDQFIFEAYLENLPRYKDEEKIIDWYVSVWDYLGIDNQPGVIDLEAKNYVFRYSMPDIGKMYKSSTTVKGELDRPAEIINMNVSFPDGGRYTSGYYKRINEIDIEVTILGLFVPYDSELWSDEEGFVVLSIPAGQYNQFVENGLLSGNYKNFTVKKVR